MKGRMRKGNTSFSMKRLRELFEEAMNLSKDERRGFIETACGDDSALRDRLNTMLVEWESGESLFDSVCQEAIWPALDSLRKDPAKLRSYVEASLEEDTATAESIIGKEISHFRILSKVGKGGMGMVYKAHDQSLDRTVALKFLPLGATVDVSARKRFIQEAKTASTLDHPNIATIYEIGETDEGQTFIVMAYYPGRTMKDMLEDGMLPREKALDYAIQLAKAIEEAHKGGVIHRDIKPGNLQITDSGVLKLIDFGLAKLSSAAGYTQVGEMVGTVAYMSPEQVNGELVDHRTDIWSVGAVLYEMVTGKRPFGGGDIQSVINSILNEDPPLNGGQGIDRSGAQGSLKTVIQACLAKDPKDRYDSASELLADLERVRQGQPALGRPLPLRRYLGMASKVAGFIVVLGAMIFVMYKWSHNPEEAEGQDGAVRFTKIQIGPFKDDAGNFGGVYWGDYDGDDYPDLLVTGLTPRLYHNEGNGTFTKVPGGGLAEQLEMDKGSAWGASWVDFDNDGDLDVYVTFFSNKLEEADRFFLNNGDGTFTRQAADWIPKDARLSVCWGDIDNDGLLDLFTANIHKGGGLIFHHQPDGNMVPLDPPIGWSLGCDWSDYDLDGDLDLFAGGRPNILFRNNGNLTFTEISPELLPGAPSRWGNTFGVTTGDYDNDGDPDLVIANQSYNQLYRNEGEAGWKALDNIPITELSGHGLAWGDYDNDGYLDLLVSGYRQLYHNEGDGTFVRVERIPLTDSITRSPGCAWADYDNDGDLDLVYSDGVRHGGEPVPPQPLSLYRNDGGKNHWLLLRLVGTESNRSAIGAKVYLEATLNGTFLRQFREVKSASGHITQNDMRVHFGLADATVIDRVTVHWPSGMTDEWTGLSANQFLLLKEGESGSR